MPGCAMGLRCTAGIGAPYRGAGGCAVTMADIVWRFDVVKAALARD
jgi:hypothetical protein